MPYYLEDPFGRITNVHWKKKDGEEEPGPTYCDPCGLMGPWEAAPADGVSLWYLGPFQPRLIGFPIAFDPPTNANKFLPVGPFFKSSRTSYDQPPPEPPEIVPTYPHLQDEDKYYYGACMTGITVRLEVGRKPNRYGWGPMGIDVFLKTPFWDLTQVTEPDATFVGNDTFVEFHMNFAALPKDTYNIVFGAFGGITTYRSDLGFGRRNRTMSWLPSVIGEPPDWDPYHPYRLWDLPGEFGVKISFQAHCTKEVTGAPPPQPAEKPPAKDPGNGWTPINIWPQPPWSLYFYQNEIPPGGGGWTEPPSGGVGEVGPGPGMVDPNRMMESRPRYNRQPYPLLLPSPIVPMRSE